jgi:hypothetical protein
MILTEEQQNIVEEIRENNPIDVEGIGRYTLADAMRRGAKATDQATGWGSGREACALHAAALDAVATGYVQVD